MPEILISPQPVADLGFCSAPYQPVVSGAGQNGCSPFDLGELSNIDVAKNIHKLSQELGDEQLVAAAEVLQSAAPLLVGQAGAMSSVYTDRMKGFQLAMRKAQNALVRYHQAVKTRASGANKLSARFAAENALAELNKSFQHEIRVVTANTKVKRNPLSNPQRALNMAKDSRHIARLDIVHPAQTHALVRMSKHAKFLSTGIVALDFTSRAANVAFTYREGGDWSRELFKESLSFGVSSYIGLQVAKAGMGLLVLLSPYGWIVLVLGGLALATATVGVTMGLDYYLKQNADSYYNAIHSL